MSSVVLVNPTAKNFSQRRLSKALSVLREEGACREVFFTRKRGDAEQRARLAAERGAETVVVIGGDGTLNEVVNALAGTSTAVGFIPCGTTNVAAKEFRIPEDPEEAALRVLNGQRRTLNLGQINGRYFLLMAGVGFDGEAVHGLNRTLKRLTGKGAYIFSGLKVTLRGLRPFRIRLGEGEMTCYTLIASNSACYGGPFKVCPGASAFKATLDVAVMLNGSRRDILRYVFGILTGRHLNYRDILFREIEYIQVLDSPHIQIDGDYYGRGPVEIKTAPMALRMVF